MPKFSPKVAVPLFIVIIIMVFFVYNANKDKSGSVEDVQKTDTSVITEVNDAISEGSDAIEKEVSKIEVPEKIQK